MTSHRLLLIAVCLLGTARLAAADCAPIRPTTAPEQKIYADELALFQRFAPPAPAGWTSEDSPKETTIKEVCAGPELVYTWTFTRTFTKDGFQARQDEAVRKMSELGKNNEARRKANEGRLKAIEDQMAATNQKMIALLGAGKFAETEPLQKEIAALQNEQQKLMAVDDMDAAIKRIEAEQVRDTTADFHMTIGRSDFDSTALTPFTAPAGKGYRQLLESRGNPWENLAVVLPAPTGMRGQIVITINGDPQRVEGLLKTTTFR